MVKDRSINNTLLKLCHALVPAWRRIVNVVINNSTFPTGPTVPQNTGAQEMFEEKSYTQRITKTRRGGKHFNLNKIEDSKGQWGSPLWWGWLPRNLRPSLKLVVTKNTSLGEASLCWFYSTVKHLLASLFFMIYTLRADSPTKIAPNYN